MSTLYVCVKILACMFLIVYVCVCECECVYVMPFLFYLELGISLLTRHCHNFRYMFWAAFVVLRPRDGGVAKLCDMLMSCKLSLIKLHCCCRHFSCQLRRMYGKL